MKTAESQLVDEAMMDELLPGALLLRSFALPKATELLVAARAIAAQAPLRHMMTPGGHPMSVAMTNCGRYGWISDRRGYRYSETDPLSGEHWPPMPTVFSELSTSAANQAGFADYAPDACLINHYEPGTRMALHQDRDEQNFTAPIVSISLGLPIVFLLGGMARTNKPLRITLEHGDVLVWGGPARLRYHGVMPLKDGDHPALGRARLNFTLRRAA